ncbi:SURF1 family protein [Citreimonas salinaria]|uniref:SURF1-like protein n=1 Tax=Citreimonas salinaria TaxID=321339 RepID=A0A1H3MJR7_9RHOB|nr:SURF1 family protein [Citreimonas salinaria]SDY76564.1 surfeit locus 1 family protein [Citreimonas salinaria]
MTRYVAPLLIGLVGAAILVALGLWQVQRLAWKEGIIADIESMIAADPQPLPRVVDPATQRYQPVALQGEIGEGALYVLVSVKRQGAGWRVISPFTTEDGRRVLLDRGFVPAAEKDTPLRAGPAAVLGNLHWPDDRNSATPENAPQDNTWYARDIGPMAEALQTEPLLVVASDVDPADARVRPLPVDSAGIPNDHLQYAITWFSLAAVWIAMTLAWIRTQAKGKD